MATVPDATDYNRYRAQRDSETLKEAKAIEMDQERLANIKQYGHECVEVAEAPTTSEAEAMKLGYRRL